MREKKNARTKTGALANAAAAAATTFSYNAHREKKQKLCVSHILNEFSGGAMTFARVPALKKRYIVIAQREQKEQKAQKKKKLRYFCLDL